MTNKEVGEGGRRPAVVRCDERKKGVNSRKEKVRFREMEASEGLFQVVHQGQGMIRAVWGQRGMGQRALELRHLML